MIEYLQGASLPNPGITWRDSAGAVIDFSAGWTFTAKAGTPGSEADLSKDSGITGAASAPNVTINWTADELDALDPGAYALDIDAVSGGEHRKMQTWLIIRSAVA